jgi:hypothetical protein
MGDFLEGLVLLLPAEVGGRQKPIAPREGSYRPFLGSIPVRFIEGPPTIAPGHSGRVVVEIEAPLPDESSLVPGSELQIIEDERVVGLLTVTRLWRRAMAF